MTRFSKADVVSPKGKMTVQRLIDVLGNVADKQMVVILEGCDCYGQWSGGVKVLPSDHFEPESCLLLCRGEDDYEDDDDEEEL